MILRENLLCIFLATLFRLIGIKIEKKHNLPRPPEKRFFSKKKGDKKLYKSRLILKFPV